MNRILSTFAALFVAASPAVAFADAIMPPPTSCPAGSLPTSSHSGPGCAPMPECANDAACEGSLRCTPIDQCIQVRPCGGRRMPPQPGEPPCTRDYVASECGPNRTCADGAECRTRSVCQQALVPPPQPPPTDPPSQPPPSQPPPAADADEDDDSCSVAPRAVTRGAVMLLSLGGVAIVVIARRRRR